MWSDNETTTDFLGFKVHSDLVREVVTDSALLPVVLGVFGDWGGGKSSIMQMLQRDLTSEAPDKVVCLYFNGWMFEGYEDAKTALLNAILLQLGEHKVFKHQVKDEVLGLLKRVQWMEVGRLAVRHVGIPLAAAAFTGGVGAIPAFLASLVPSPAEALAAAGQAASGTQKGGGSGEKDNENWLGQIVAEPGTPDLLEVRKFRDDFAAMLAKTDITSLVILIDDLDRCLPDRIIETLEAIKLFVAVPKTAFVIGADPRIVRHAIATRYARLELGREADEEEEYDLVKDYLEKLIQIPYHLPRLSPAEIETYINLLLCQRHLKEAQCTQLLARLDDKRKGNWYTAFSLGDVRDVCGAGLPAELELQLAWSNAVSLPITEGLKGNPRQVKRMLNAMVLRTKLARIARLDIRAEVLAKLMVLEYTEPKRFADLERWQAAGQGYPDQLKRLEAVASESATAKTDTDPGLEDWRKPRLQSWVSTEPPLSDVDLRDYFWIARDRTKSTLAAVSFVSPLVRNLFRALISDNQGEKYAAVASAAELQPAELETLLSLLSQQLSRHPDQAAAYDGFLRLISDRTEGAFTVFLDALRQLPTDQIPPSVPGQLGALAKTKMEMRPEIVRILAEFAGKPKTGVGKAAAIEMKGLQ